MDLLTMKNSRPRRPLRKLRLLNASLLITMAVLASCSAGTPPQSNLVREQAMKEAITATVLEQEMTQESYQTWMVCKIQFENRSPQSIRVFQGTLVFRDVFDNELVRFDLDEQDPLKSGEKRITKRRWEFNQFIAGHVRWANARQENTKVEWIPRAVMFADGSIIHTN